MSDIFMKCGCAAQGHRVMPNGDRLPSCIIHNCIEQAEAPNLEGRTARCTYSSCKKYLAKYNDTHYGELRQDGRSYAPSSLKLPFFEYKPTEEYDKYFCGCMGWD